MISRRFFLGGSAAAASSLALGSCAKAGADNDNVIRYWGMGAADKDKDEAVAAAFAKTDAGRDVKISIDQVPSNGVSDMSQIITAVRGGTAPDLWWQDRFNTVQNASVGLLEPIDGLIEKYEGVSKDEFAQQWIQFAIDELTYDGHLYGLPVSTDARGLAYNENVLKEAGLDLDMFDPSQHVMTWDEVREAARQITKKNKRGNYEKLGFAPWVAEGWAYTWAFGVGAQAYDNSSSQVTMDTPEWQKVFEIYQSWAEEFEYPLVDAFYATYEPPNHPPTQSALFSNRLGMTTTGPWDIQGFEKYAPDLPLKFTWLPIEKDGDDTYTWSGGQSLVIPKGANITKNLWEYLKFHAGYPGQSIIQPKLGNLPTNLEAIQKKKYNPKAELFRQMLPTSTSRPPLPAGSAIWDALNRTKSSVSLGSSTPEQAIQTNQDYVEPKMKVFPDYKMPDTYGKPSPVPKS